MYPLVSHFFGEESVNMFKSEIGSSREVFLQVFQKVCTLVSKEWSKWKWRRRGLPWQYNSERPTKD
jgi:hypothetical protein